MSSIKYEFVFDMQNTINPEMELDIYRIIKELVNNIEKYAYSTKASIQLLAINNQITIMAEDNGIGFDADKNLPGIGLNNISSRINYLKGSLYIDSNKNGTTISIQIPI